MTEVKIGQRYRDLDKRLQYDRVLEVICMGGYEIKDGKIKSYSWVLKGPKNRVQISNERLLNPRLFQLIEE